MIRVLNRTTAVLLFVAAACGPGASLDPPPVAQVVILPNDTILRVAGDEFTTAVDLEMRPDGSLLVRRSSGASLTIRPDVTPAALSTGNVDGPSDSASVLDDLDSDLTAPPRAALPDGGYWTVTDSVPRVQKVSSSGEVEVDVPIVDVQLTPIRVRAASHVAAGAASTPVRYATDIEVVGSRVWVLLNVSVGEGAVLLGFDDTGRQLYRMELPATEGGRQFVIDTTRARFYAVGPEIPLVLAVSLEGHENLWRERP